MDTTVSVCQASASKIPWDLLSCTVAIRFVVSTEATAPSRFNLTQEILHGRGLPLREKCGVALSTECLCKIVAHIWHRFASLA